ncbi:hypothetical protein Tco_0603031, partial [Tanacetum coccineum]
SEWWLGPEKRKVPTVTNELGVVVGYGVVAWTQRGVPTVTNITVTNENVGSSKRGVIGRIRGDGVGPVQFGGAIKKKEKPYGMFVGIWAEPGFLVKRDDYLSRKQLVEDKLNYLEHPIHAAPVPAHAGQQVPPEALAAHVAWVKGQKEIAGLMLMTMEPDIQRNLENLGPYDMIQELKTLFAQQAEQELL